METSTAVVTVYTKPSCVQCQMTYLALDKKGIRYEAVDITRSPEALEYITEELGYSQAPVLVVTADEENNWSGFRPDKIDALAAALAQDL